MKLLANWNRLAALLAMLFAAGSSYAQPTHAPPISDVANAALLPSDFSRYADAPTWAEGEKNAFTALFKGSRYEWLVAPVQVQQQGFDRPERSLMTAELTHAFAECGLSLPDPYLLQRALGEGSRRISLNDIDRFAQVVGAKNIVVPFVGHNESNSMILTLGIFRKPDVATSIFTVRPIYLTVSDRQFSDEIAPIEVFAAALPELLSGIGLQTSSHPQPGNSTTKLGQLPDAPEMLAAPHPVGSLADAARFAVFGEIAPPRTRGSERLFERSLLAARRAPQTAEQRFLNAYALFRLNLRPAAMRILQSGSSPGIVALKAIVNGNLTGTETLVHRASGYERLILEIELNDLAHAYGHAEQRPLPPPLVALSSRSPTWQALLEPRWNYSNTNHDLSNVALKRVLDRIYPLEGESLDELLAAHAAAPGMPATASYVELTVHEHIRHLMTTRRGAWCCSSVAERPNPWDFVSLIESWSEVNLVRAVGYELFILGLPKDARQMLAELDPYYGGRPEFEVLHAQADHALARQTPQAGDDTYLRSAQRHAVQALISAEGQTDSAVEALEELGPGDTLAMSIARAYGLDYPLSEYWLSNNNFVLDPKERLALARRALANTQTGVSYISLMLMNGGDAVKVEAASALRGRFRGNQGLDAVLESLTPAPDRPATEEIARLRKKLRAEPDVWETRNALAGLLVAQRDYADAARILAGYPGFSAEAPMDGIYLSNIAAEAGHMFYWRGAEKEARQLYEIATRYEVGSEAEMTAAMHLRLLDNDLDGALEQAGMRVERYPNGLAYCNYLSLLHLLGRSEEAWKTFKLLLNQPMGPGPWESAMVGQRIARLTQEGLDRWLAQPEINQAGTYAVSWAATYLIMWSATDRAAAADLAELVRHLAHEPRGVVEGDGRIASYPAVVQGQRFLVIRSDFGTGRRQTLKDQTAVESDQPLFAQALVPLQHGDLATAVSRFDELTARYPIERRVQGADAVYALPDFAYASAKSADPLKLEAFIEGLPKDSDFFETWLARAYFQALAHHDNGAALKSLDQAFLRIEHYFGRTPSMEYQYADVAERLFRDTADNRFRDRALIWSHMFQHLQPWSAWAYAMEAELTDDPEARQSTLVRALFLDPLSPRLKSIPVAELERAQAQLSHGNPFLHPQARKIQGVTTGL